MLRSEAVFLNSRLNAKKSCLCRFDLGMTLLLRPPGPLSLEVLCSEPKSFLLGSWSRSLCPFYF